MLRPFNRSIHLWILAYAIVGFTYFGVQAVLFNLYLLRLGFEPQFIGVLVGSGQVLFALASLPAGVLGQRVGVRGAFIAGLCLIAIAYAMLLLVEAVPRAAWVPWLFVWWAVLWTGAAATNVNSVPYAMSMAGDEAPRAFALQSTALGLSTVGGNLAGGLLLGVVADLTGSSLADPAPYRIVQWLTPPAFAIAAAAMLAARSAPRYVHTQGSTRGAGPPLGLFVLLGLIVFLFTVSEGTLRAFFNVYLDTRLGVPPSQIGAAMGLGMLLSIGAPLAVPMLVGRFGTAGTLAVVSVVCAAGLLALAAGPFLLVAVLAYMTVMSMAAIHAPTRNVFSQQIVNARWRATTAAIINVGMGLGWASAAAVGGQLLSVFDFRGLFFLVSGLVSVGAVVSWGYVRGLQVQRLAAATSNLVASTPVSGYPPD
jgi:MFS family permease